MLKWAKNLFDKTHVVRVSWLVTGPHMCPCRGLAEGIKFSDGKAEVPLVTLMKSQLLKGWLARVLLTF